MQRIRKQDSTVVIEIAMLTLSQVADIKVYVKRIKEIVDPPVGSVELEVEKKRPTYDKVLNFYLLRCLWTEISFFFRRSIFLTY